MSLTLARRRLTTTLRTAALVALTTLVASSSPLLAAGTPDWERLRLYAELLTLARDQYGAEITYRELVDASVNGALRRLDPHTSFLTPQSFTTMRSRQQSTFYGVGMLVSRRSGRVTVMAPLEGAPAERVGLRAGDVIVAIDGEATEMWTLDEAVERIKGPKGTEVTLRIARQGLSEPFDVTIVRDEIPQSTVRYAYMMTPDTGYVRLVDFRRSTAQETREALERLRAQGMKRLLLDLRSNGGGLLDQVVEVSELFLPPGSLIVSTRGRTPDSYEEYRTGAHGRELGLPVAVLVNGGTASAAEILSGAIQDHDLGLIVGTPTWGKGLVQTVFNLSYRAGIALTTARYYTPSGRVIQRDYSDFFDYYTGLDSSAEEGVETERDPAEIFSTDLGREVYGGGGITPDVVVEIPEVSETMQRLFLHNAFFDFAIAWEAEHQDLESTWEPGDEVLEKFSAWLLEQEVLNAAEVSELLADEGSRELVKRRIHADVFNSARGPEAAHRVLAAGDLQIERALELLTEAGELLEQRRLLTAAPAPPAPAAPPRSGVRRADELTRGALSGMAELPRPARAAYSFALAKRLSEEGALREALGAFERSLDLDGRDAYHHLEQARLYAWLARMARDGANGRRLLTLAGSGAAAAAERDPDNLEVLKGVAQIHLQMDEGNGAGLAKARQALERVRTGDPADVEALVTLAAVYQRQQQPQQAVAVLLEAEAYLPSPAIRSRLAQAMVAAGDLDGAETVLQTILAQQPRSLDHWLLLVDLHSQQGEHRQAIDAIRSAPADIQADASVKQLLEREQLLLDRVLPPR